MAAFQKAALICVIAVAFVDQGLSCGPGGGSSGGVSTSRPRPTTTSRTTVSCPRIVSRAGWNARRPTGTTRIRQPVPRVFIHHTVTSSCSTSSSCASMVRGIQRYHMDTNRWSDIGYNFLVGGDGTVYEGRGWDRVGAHVRGYNSLSIGIAFIGTFTNTKPNTAALNTAKQLIRCGVSQGKLANNYRLFGHRDGGNTECPGRALYSEIRTWPRYG